jgi:hypothetical protein
VRLAVHTRIATLVIAVVAATTLTPAGDSGAAPATGQPASALESSQAFLDTFAGSVDNDPLYGLNVGLDTRQAAASKVSYTRLSGQPNGGAAPASWYVQVNHPVHPNQLLFTSGTSAVMLGAPAVADDGGHYTVSTAIDPVVGDIGSADWASLMLTRARTSAGYVTNADIDLGLTVRSNGRLDLYSAGQLFWSSSVAPAAQYATSITVSTGADRTLVLVVNGTAFTVVAPAQVSRWPSTAYLYLGAYLSSSTEVTAFGSGLPGQGLSISRVDTAIAASANVFVDTFDGSVDTDPTGYGLDDGLRARQPAVVASRYTRISGQPNRSTPPSPWQSQVNHPAYPNRLSFWTGPSAVRLNNPVAAGLDGAYAVHAVIDPVANGGDIASQDWASLVFSASSTSNGYPTTADTDLGLTIRSNGRVQLYQRGSTTWRNEQVIAPAADGSFDVTVSVATGTGRVAITINGIILSATARNLPRAEYLSLGSYTTDANAVSTVDDLRVSMLGGLAYYGYFDVMDPTDHKDHSSDVAAYTNLNLYLEATSPHAYLDYCRPRSCVFNIQWQQFTENQAGTGLTLRPDSAANVAALRADVGSNLDKVGAIYLIDEPYHNSNDRRVTAADLQAATDQVRQSFPGLPLLLTLDGPSVTAANPPAIPQQIDMVGFDWYCISKDSLSHLLSALQSRLTAYQNMYLIPESSPGNCSGSTDAGIAARQAVYHDLAVGNSRVRYLMNFGWWLGGAGAGSPFTDLPLTSSAQQVIGKAIVDPA